MGKRVCFARVRSPRNVRPYGPRCAGDTEGSEADETRASRHSARYCGALVRLIAFRHWRAALDTLQTAGQRWPR